MNGLLKQRLLSQLDLRFIPSTHNRMRQICTKQRLQSALNDRTHHHQNILLRRRQSSSSSFLRSVAAVVGTETRSLRGGGSGLRRTQSRNVSFPATTEMEEPTTATSLVDAMLNYTSQLLEESVQSKSAALHVVAFSGGVDSSLATALLRNVLQTNRFDHPSNSLLAVLGVSPAVSAEQMAQAERIAHELNVDFRKVTTNEGHDPQYVANQGQACRACKTHLYSTLQTIHSTFVGDSSERRSNGHSTSLAVRLYNGTNADDLLDPTRVGLVAAHDFGVHSPLRHFSKEQVRIAAKQLGLSNWQMAASPCLRSRLALGVTATAQHLHRIEQAERHVRHALRYHLTERSNLRVRQLTHNRACIEIDSDVLEHAQHMDWQDELVQSLGFASVQVRQFRSGSVASSPNNNQPTAVWVTTTTAS